MARKVRNSRTRASRENQAKASPAQHDVAPLGGAGLVPAALRRSLRSTRRTTTSNTKIDTAEDDHARTLSDGDSSHDDENDNNIMLLGTTSIPPSSKNKKSSRNAEVTPSLTATSRSRSRTRNTGRSSMAKEYVRSRTIDERCDEDLDENVDHHNENDNSSEYEFNSNDEDEDNGDDDYQNGEHFDKDDETEQGDENDDDDNDGSNNWLPGKATARNVKSRRRAFPRLSSLPTISKKRTTVTTSITSSRKRSRNHAGVEPDESDDHNHNYATEERSSTLSYKTIGKNQKGRQQEARHRRSPLRIAAMKASAKMAKYCREDHVDDGDGSDDNRHDAVNQKQDYPASKRKKIITKKAVQHDSDDEFRPEDELTAEDSVDESIQDDHRKNNYDDDCIDECSDVGENRRTTRSQRVTQAVGVVQDDDIGSADESDSGQEVPWQSPRLNLVNCHGPKKSIQRSIGRPAQDHALSNNHPQVHNSDVDSCTSSTSHNDYHASRGFAPQRLDYCPSREDVITLEPLPERHVCYYPPDGKSLHCFSLGTLRKVALAASSSSGDSHAFFGSSAGRVVRPGEAVFLQPPHFRTPMSDDLLDQIASRFGREALDLHGSYYSRPLLPDPVLDNEENVNNEGGTTSEQRGNALVNNYDNRFDNVAEFIDQVERYVQSRMGNQDLYVCPLCYTGAHQRLKQEKHQESTPSSARWLSETIVDPQLPADLNEWYPISEPFSYDPMLILESLDDGLLELASTFCYKRVSEVKVHLREDHGVSTRYVAGNELYARFKIRGTDGLLQQYLAHRGRSKYQGSMQRYWFGGNNYAFVLLAHLVLRAEFARQVLQQDHHDSRKQQTDDSDDNQVYFKAQQYMEPAHTYFQSMDSVVEQLWEHVIEPYRIIRANELHDFIAPNDEDEQDEDDNNGVESKRGRTSVYRELEQQEWRNSLERDHALAARYEREARKQAQVLDADEEISDRVENEGDDWDESDGNSEGAGDWENEEDDITHLSDDEVDEWEESIRIKKRGSIGKRRSRAKSRRRGRGENDDYGVNKKLPAAVDNGVAATHKRRIIVESDEEP